MPICGVSGGQVAPPPPDLNPPGKLLSEFRRRDRAKSAGGEARLAVDAKVPSNIVCPIVGAEPSRKVAMFGLRVLLLELAVLIFQIAPPLTRPA